MEKRAKRVKVRYAESLSEVYRHIYNISEEIKDANASKGENSQARPLMWFRGHSHAEYNLNPNIFRGAEYHYNKKETYSNNHLREEYRFQNFRSRNFDNLRYGTPQTVIEWQEVMQHFFAKTRLMDWSESLTVSLEFALEAFIDPVENLEILRQRKTADPVIWILQPVDLNREIYHALASKKDLIRRALGDGVRMRILAEAIREELGAKENTGIYFGLKNGREQNMDAMISLSSLEIIRNAFGKRGMEALKRYEINPFFYLLLRYYSDGVPVKLGELPPLAIIHPYHSERIKIQKGVFTAYPYYIPDENYERMREITGREPGIAMEYMEQCIPYLHQIQLVNPRRIADELLLTGAKRSNLYPDMQIVSQDIENVVSG